jgi:hypothetical protein
VKAIREHPLAFFLALVLALTWVVCPRLFVNSRFCSLPVWRSRWLRLMTINDNQSDSISTTASRLLTLLFTLCLVGKQPVAHRAVPSPTLESSCPFGFPASCLR